ncbi:ergothioneine biosynthesis protein EgtB [Priestia endophytica]|uniref:Ergothioneine biosynthesis protein EgtB n=1 Tax=Priestia endophytica TaxID=135735 RepID=A0AAX1Q1X5_9BACI|nr:ergothioneine biosynthesis protein EgtB [Priestia endophytica]RAS71964.1 hypothetical protein A3864_23060 [Priestia endophytica]RAS89582.1 hypothetical protein A3863_10190 [Priestia endophytica]
MKNETAVKENIAEKYKEVRTCTEKIVAPLQTEDYIIQAGPDASPPKWHLAHTTWFFERFVLKEYKTTYEALNNQFDYLFNSYYETVGEFHPRAQRGVLARPSIEEVKQYRYYIDAHMKELFEELTEENRDKVLSIVEIGLQHEQQHQELLLTDIKYNFFTNPLLPAYISQTTEENGKRKETSFIEIEGGLIEVGHDNSSFSFDNERPRHKVWLESYRIADAPVTNREYIEFIEDGGYERPELWLSDGWAHIKKEGWTHPLYWKKDGEEWSIFTLHGQSALNLDEPVCHVSFYEGDAFARWKGKRLPTEQEWEHVFSRIECEGNFVENNLYHPNSHYKGNGPLYKGYGDVWEWTRSPYVPYPKSKPLEGALGEYNAKFMCNQMVLKGGSCATPHSHIRPTYRNFFQPEKRWQFTGFRLAEDV